VASPTSCVNQATDPLNCGACGTTCGANQFCSGGSCLPCGTDGGACCPGNSCDGTLLCAANLCG
jgi:hypothetical protein